MKKIRWVMLLAMLFLVMCTGTAFAYIPYTDFYPSIGLTQYLGDVKICGESVSVHIADNDTINTMVYWKYYTKENRKWTAKVLLVPNTEKLRQVFVKMLNEGANNDTWAINNHLSLPINNKVWALREDISYYPNGLDSVNEKIINVRGAWVYNTDGEMLGFDKYKSQKTIAFYYGQGDSGEMYAPICDLVSSFMEERYQEAVINSHNAAR